MKNSQNNATKKPIQQVTPPKKVEQPTQSSQNKEAFIKKLELFYFGESVAVLEAAQKLAGPKGKVSYKVTQPEDLKGTDYVSVSFLLTRNDRRPFTQMKFSLLVNTTTNFIVDSVNIFVDQKGLTEKELIFKLGGFGSESIVEKKEKARMSFLKTLSTNPA